MNGLWQKLRRLFRSMRARCQLIYSCQIPSRFYGRAKFPHPVGIVIGDGVRMGERVRIYQNVTIGLIENDVHARPTDYPNIEDDVCVYAGAVIAGGVTIGKRSIIGANAVITCDIPADSVAFGHNKFRPL